MTTSPKNLFGFIRHSTEENESQESIFEKSKIKCKNIFKFVCSGYNKDIVVNKINY